MLSARTQIDMALVQGGVAHEVAYDHAARGEDQYLSARRGGFVGNAVLSWWLFVLLPALWWTLMALVGLAPVWYPLGLIAFAVGLKRRLKRYRNRPVREPAPYLISTVLVVMAWFAFGASPLVMRIVGAFS